MVTEGVCFFFLIDNWTFLCLNKNEQTGIHVRSNHGKASIPNSSMLPLFPFKKISKFNLGNLVNSTGYVSTL